jgi:hypothetical protein
VTANGALQIQLMIPGESTLEILLGGFLFGLFLVAQVAAVIAVQAERADHNSPAFDAMRCDHGARAIWGAAS